MYFEQFFLSCLAHASYLIGSEGMAAVVDPQRDVDIYLTAAKVQGLRIAHIVETHLHADFVSGHRELAERTGATIHVGARAQAGYPHHAIKEGDELRLGRAVLRFIETPGHTAESVCVLVTDLERSAQPWAVLTGDTMFIGDVGRPDLSPNHTPQELAALLYGSLHNKLLHLPDEVEVYPAHGAGSLCGKNISPERRSTIGKERKFNYALQPMSRPAFVQLLTAELPTRPEYFLRDAEINRAGAPALGELPELPALTPEQVRERQDSGATVLDTRTAAEFGARHVPGSMHIALGGQYASWAGILIGLDQPLILVAGDAEQIEEARMRLARVGMENVVGYLATGIAGWQRAGLPLDTIPQISVLDLQQQLIGRSPEWQVLDVRRLPEWEMGHIAGARLKPLDRLHTMLNDLDPARPVAVHCKSGYRSSIATSLLRRAGFQQVFNVTGGFDAWQAHNLPVSSSVVNDPTVVDS
jgi:hydroxyacylglutathione hydrolase